MKQIYIVVDSGYHAKPLMAYENRNDAVKTACAIHDCNASDASGYIKTVPFMYDQPRTIDLTDVQTVIDLTLQAVETVGNIQNKGDDNG